MKHEPVVKMPRLVQCATCGAMMPDDAEVKATHRRACRWDPLPPIQPWWSANRYGLYFYLVVVIAGMVWAAFQGAR